jgi:hypothetical protein
MIQNYFRFFILQNRFNLKNLQELIQGVTELCKSTNYHLILVHLCGNKSGLNR